LDRGTGKLVPCNKDRCPNAIYYEDIGLVNYAPYAAFGGWSGAVRVPALPHVLLMSFLVLFSDPLFFVRPMEISRKKRRS